MTEIVIGLKCGKEIILECDECTVTRNNFTCEITNIEWEGVTNIKPMFIDVREIEYVYQILKEDGDRE